MSGWEILVSNSLFQVMAWSLIHFLWQGAVVAVVLALTLTLIPRRFSQVRYLAAASAMALMLMLPILTGWTLWSGTSVAAPMSMGAVPVESISIQNWSIPEEAGPQPGFASQTALQTRVKPWLPVVVFLWLAGVALLSLRNFGGLLGASTLSRRGTFAPPEEWEKALRRLARRMGVTQTVRLVGSHLVSVPMVVGWLRPVILVPAGAFTGLHPRELEAILAHELAHIRRYDYFVNLVQTFVETVLFYHPAVWWVSRQIREERENCCDDIAVASCGDVKIYAEALARMESLRVLAPNFAMGADGGSLLSRITRLVG
jgi:beta-lactamase regulating signal transducer with metallopeptidase domain